ncbi:MAG: CRTAC1 family protein [Planctomycetota bacterium]|nr:CRTAC1 family protein [Planctomycetota bacterium]
MRDRESRPQGLVEPLFEDRAPEWGVDFSLYRDAVKDRFFFPEVMGAGIAWLDYDLDGFWDLYLANGDALVAASQPQNRQHQNQLFRNLLETGFDAVTDFAAPDGRGFSQGLATGDANRDGFVDLFVSNHGQNYLLLNLGDGSFSSQPVGDLANEPLWSTSCVQVDLDQDDDLDIVVASYVDWTVGNHHPCNYKGTAGYCGPGTYAATRDLVYENQGDGTYVEVGQSAGFDFKSKGLVVCAADFDHDRNPEIYLGSDLTRNAFYRQREKGLKYENIADDSGVAASKNGLAEATMGLAVRDFDQNGEIDLFLTHYYQNKNTLYLNQQGLLFKDASYETRIKNLSFDFIGFGTVAIDYDHDTDFDLFISNGHVLGEQIPPFRLTPQLINNSECRFFDLSSQSGIYFQRKFAGRSVASCDFDNDGDVDLCVGHLDAPYALLENRTRSGNKSIQLQLLDQDRQDLVGTEVIVHLGAEKVVLPVVRGQSYLSAMDPRLHLGVGELDAVGVTVHWAAGGKTEFENLATDRTWLLSPEGNPVQMPGPRQARAPAR